MLIGLWILLDIYRPLQPGVYRSIMLVVGILSLVLGLILILNPFDTSRVIVVIIGAYSLIYGIVSLLHNLQKVKQ